MKRSLVFLTPATKDKAGEVVELQYESEPVQFLEPVANDDSSDLGVARHRVHVATAALRHARSKNAPQAEIKKLEAELRTAKVDVTKLHYAQEKQRQRERVGADTPFSRQFMEPVPYFTRNDTDTDTDESGRTFDDEADDELEAKILAAVEALEQAQSNGATPTEMLRLEQALKVLREQLPNPSAPPADTTAAPPRKSHIGPDSPGSLPASQAGIPGSNPDPKPSGKKKSWKQFLSALDDRLAKKALRALRTGGATTAAAHSENICCQGQHLCERCKAKAHVLPTEASGSGEQRIW